MYSIEDAIEVFLRESHEDFEEMLDIAETVVDAYFDTERRQLFIDLDG